ncbi:calcium-binding protein [Musa troglodytarum]|uniref:Calcium-binding protein n=1 Tax=Musa troglodytarum TaxID=320322 RepID=A0A9E7G1J0_9LILI|nr:calcium-binding protein [Musa troglodytarum]
MSKAARWFSPRRSKLSLPAEAPPPAPGRRDRMEVLWEVFRHFDQDRDGRISCGELRASFAAIGEEMPVAAAEAAIADLDSDGDRLLDFEDFVRLMERGGGKAAEEGGEEEELRQAFEMFEAVKGSGRITPRGVQRMLSRLGDERSMEECEAMVRAYDLDGDGELDFHEFHRMMN